MQPDSPFTQNRIRQIVIVGLIVVGLGLLLGIGGKAMSQINDPSFVYGKQRQQLLSEPDALATGMGMSGGTLLPAGLQATSPGASTASPNDKPVADKNNTEHKPDRDTGPGNAIASARSGKRAAASDLD